MRASRLLVAFVPMAAAGVLAQAPAFRASVDLIAVDVLVSRSSGEPVPGLTPADFDVRIDGRARRVVSAEFVRSAAPRPAAGGGGAARNDWPTSAAPDRTFILALDSASLRPGDALPVIQAATAFTARVPASDLIGVVVLPNGERLNPTVDRAKVRQVVSRLVGTRRTLTTSFHLNVVEVIEIYGVIMDPANAPLPGVSITVAGDAIQGPRTVESEANGSYRLLHLPQGEYRITYQKAGLKRIVNEGAKVELGKTLTMNMTMRIADIEETVVVTGSSSMVDVRNATIGTNFGASMLRDIPHQRDLSALLTLTPGITMPRPDVGGNTAGTQSAYRTYGLSGQSITTVDGVNISAGADGGAAVGAVSMYIDYGAVADAKVSGAANSAEVAVAGAAVTTVIKSGSNRHHGELFADAKTGGGTGGTGLDDYRRYRDINGQLGGPFIKDRLWYFMSIRNQYTAFRTGMYDRPAAEGGTPGQTFITETANYTLKLNYQLSPGGTLAFVTQVGRKYQPHRLGSGISASRYSVESTALQNSWSEIGKVDYVRVLNNRATLDASVNIFANQFPLTAHTDKTPMVDDVTHVRTGAYNAPSFMDGRRWHYNTNFTLYADRHDMKIGYMYQWYSPRHTAFGAPGPADTAGHVQISTTNGMPTAFWTDNGPLWNVNTLENHALFFQDKFSVTSNLTLNYGLRFDQYHSAYPEQRFGLNGNKPCGDDTHCEVGPFAVGMVTPARDVVTFNTLVPRVALIYDLFGNSKTVLKGSWGRYATDPAESLADLVNPIDLVARKYAWDMNYLTANPAVGANRITPAYVGTLRPIDDGAQLTPAAVDPDLKDSYTGEYTLGVEQEIRRDLRGYVTIVRKQQKNTFGTYDRLRTMSAYSAVEALDPGPDGLVGGSDDRTITVWETDVPPDTTDYFLTNKPIGDTYTAVELGVTKRMSGNWQLTSGVDWTKRHLSSVFSENPNTVFWSSNNNTDTTGWTVKASGSYLFKYGLMVAFSYSAMKGEPYGRSFTVTQQYLRLADPNRTTRLLQGNQQIAADKAGTYYLPAINLISMRVQKEFIVRDTQRFHLMVNIFNLAGVEPVTSVDQRTGPAFGQPEGALGGTVVRLGARYTF